MAASTIPAVKAALVAQIAAALPTVTVTWAVPRGEKGREWVLVGNVRGDQRAAAIGRSRRAETYIVEIQVTCVRPNVETPQSVSDRAFEIVAEIEDVLRTDETLGNLSYLIKAEVVKTDLTEGLLENEERMSEVMVHVACETRI